MTNVEQVRTVLPRMKGRFTISDVRSVLPELTSDQVSKALRSIKMVTSHGNGKYSVSGRRVMR